MIFVFFILLLGYTYANSAVRICIPDEITTWGKTSLENHITSCLANNFAWLPEKKTIEPFTNAFMEAIEYGKQADMQDDDLFYKKRSFMTALRQTKLKVTHHIHAIHKCANIAHKMPTKLMDAYSNEAEIMRSMAQLWSTHVKQDITQCQHVLEFLVKKQHRNILYELKYAQTNYQDSIQKVEKARQYYQQQINHTFEERKKLISMIHT